MIKERIIVPVETARTASDGEMLSLGRAHVVVPPREGESTTDTVQAVISEIISSDINHLLWRKGMDHRIGVRLVKPPEVLVQQEIGLRGRAVRLGKHSLWRTVERHPIPAN